MSWSCLALCLYRERAKRRARTGQRVDPAANSPGFTEPTSAPRARSAPTHRLTFSTCATHVKPRHRSRYEPMCTRVHHANRSKISFLFFPSFQQIPKDMPVAGRWPKSKDSCVTRAFNLNSPYPILHLARWRMSMQNSIQLMLKHYLRLWSYIPFVIGFTTAREKISDDWRDSSMGLKYRLTL